MARSQLRALGRYDALLLASLLWFLAKFLRYAFPPLFDPIGAEYGVSEARLGGAFTAFMLVYAAMQFPSGVLSDRVGSVRVVTAGALVAVVGALAIVVPAWVGTAPFALVVAAMVVVGAGTGAHKTVAIGLLSRIYASRSGRALGVHDTLGTFGGVAAPAAVAVALAVDALEWRSVFLAAAGFGAVVAVLFALRVPRHVSSERSGADGEDRPLRDYLAPFRAPRFAAFVALAYAFGFGYNGVVAFLPLYLTREVGLAATVASLLYGVLFAVTLVQLATGELSDRVGRLPVVASTIGLAGVALAVLLVAPALGPTWRGVPLGTAAVVAALGVGAHGFRPVRAAHLDELLPTEIAAGGLGVVRTGFMGSGAIAPAIVGVAAERAGYRPAFGLLVATLAASTAIALALWATERRARDGGS